MRTSIKASVVLALTMTGIQPVSAAAPVVGRWVTHDRTAIITISPCGPALCGRVERFLVPMPGDSALDRRNPDPALRSRPVIGVTVLTGFTNDGGRWKGRTYDPKSGRSYRSFLIRSSEDAMTVRGCVGPLCRSFVWRRIG